MSNAPRPPREQVAVLRIDRETGESYWCRARWKRTLRHQETVRVTCGRVVTTTARGLEFRAPTCPACMGRQDWTADEVQVLRNHSAHMSPGRLAKRLPGRTAAAIEAKRIRMRLPARAAKPAPVNTRRSVSFTGEFFERLARRAKQEGISPARLIRRLVEPHLGPPPKPGEIEWVVDIGHDQDDEVHDAAPSQLTFSI